MNDPSPAMGRKTISAGGVAAIVVFLFCSGWLALWWPRLQGARWAACVTQSKNNLKYIGLGLHNYHDVHETFPAGGTATADQRPMHSWQALILPMIDGGPKWYSNISFDEPWDDQVNETVFRHTVPVYLNPCISNVAPVNGYGISHYAGNSRVLPIGESLALSDITDGTSNTIMAGEVAAGFKAWGDPTNVRDPADGFGNDDRTFGAGFRPGAQFLMADGRVQYISETTAPEILEALSTPADGEAIEDF